MAATLQNAQDASRYLQALLKRLVTVGVDAERNGLAHVPRLGEFSLQNIDRVCLVEQFGFEIQAGREPKVGVRRARKAVDAAMAASAVRVDGHVETHVGRIVRG